MDEWTIASAEGVEDTSGWTDDEIDEWIARLKAAGFNAERTGGGGVRVSGEGRVLMSLPGPIISGKLSTR